MKFIYNPEKVNLKHPFRYINGVVVRAGFNDISDLRQINLLEQNDTFQNLIEKGAISIDNPPKKSTTKKQEVKVEEKPSPPPDETPTQEAPEDFTKLAYKDAIALIEQTTDKESLLKYQEQENNGGVRVRVLNAIESRIAELSEVE